MRIGRRRSRPPVWQYDELRQRGIDYEDEAEVQIYDERTQKIRDVQGEILDILYLLNLKPGQTVLEIGTGTGEFAIAAARHCSRVYALDVSPPMLKYAEKKALAQGISNVGFIKAGFLTYSHHGPPLDAVVTQLALHYLPDFWKQVALVRMASILKEGGKLYLRDIAYSFDPRDYEKALEEHIAKVRGVGGEEAARYAVSHVRDEYPTFDWVLEGMLKRAGFAVEREDQEDGFTASFFCTKIPTSNQITLKKNESLACKGPEGEG